MIYFTFRTSELSSRVYTCATQFLDDNKVAIKVAMSIDKSRYVSPWKEVDKCISICCMNRTVVKIQKS